MIPMPEPVIDRVNILVKYQQELLVFTDHKGRLIVDSYVELTGVDVDGDENEAPLKLKMKMISNIKRVKRRSIPISRTKPLFNNPPK